MYYQKNGGTSADVVTRAYYNNKIVFETASNNYPKNTIIFKSTRQSLVGKMYKLNNIAYTLSDNESFEQGVYTNIVSHPELVITSLKQMLDANGNVNYLGQYITEINFINFDTSQLTNLDSLFMRCYWLKTITGMNGWDVSKVTTAIDLFRMCYNLCGQVDLTGWKPNAIKFNGMFQQRANNTIYCPSGGTVLKIIMPDFDGTQNFYGCNNGNNNTSQIIISTSEGAANTIITASNNAANISFV